MDNKIVDENVPLDKVESICQTMNCTPNDILEFIDESKKERDDDV